MLATLVRLLARCTRGWPQLIREEIKRCNDAAGRARGRKMGLIHGDGAYESKAAPKPAAAAATSSAPSPPSAEGAAAAPSAPPLAVDLSGAKPLAEHDSANNASHAAVGAATGAAVHDGGCGGAAPRRPTPPLMPVPLSSSISTSASFDQENKL